MDVNNPVVQLCIQGACAEFAGEPETARMLYQQAWDTAQNDFEACVAAHYVARFQDSPQDALRWNREALTRAQAAPPELVAGFYGSLYLNLGRSYELLGNQAEAQHYYGLAAHLGYTHRS